MDAEISVSRVFWNINITIDYDGYGVYHVGWGQISLIKSLHCYRAYAEYFRIISLLLI